MRCTQCGAMLSRRSAFCTECGAQTALPASTHTAVNASPLVFAGFWLRAAAFVIDGVLLSVVFSIVEGILANLLGVFSGDDVWLSWLFLGSSGLVLTWLWYAAFESSDWQATPGKKLLRLKVTTLQGEKVSFVRALGRQVGKVVSNFLLGLGYVLAAFTRRKQALHDLFANTLVLRDVA